jgi:predicted TIM-barrel fold metal-dependent hydrolase
MKKDVKVDLHVHCALERKETGRVSPRNPLDCYVADYEELRAHLESQGIGKAVLMSSGEGNTAEKTFGTNEECAAVVQKYPDFFAWMCNFDPIDSQTVYERMSRYKEQGAIGVGELSVNEWMDSPFLTEVFAAAEKLDLPVTIHMSPEPGYEYGVCDRAGLPLLEQTLKQFPKLKILGHSQLFWLEISSDCPKEGNEMRNSMGRGSVQTGGRVEQLLRQYPNLYGDLSAYSGSCAILRDEAYGLAFIEGFSDKLFFATDTINSQQTFPLGAFLNKVYEDGRLSKDTYEKICYRNAQNILGL